MSLAKRRINAQERVRIIYAYRAAYYAHSGKSIGVSYRRGYCYLERDKAMHNGPFRVSDLELFTKELLLCMPVGDD